MEWNSFAIISNYVLIYYSDFTKSNDRMTDKTAVAHQWSASNIGKSSTQTKRIPSPMYDGSPSTCNTNHGNKKLGLES